MTALAELADTLAERISVDDARLLREETLAAIEVLFEVPVELVEPGEVMGPCGLEGRYLDKPPRIVVATSSSDRRVAFTALHELGHHLVTLNREVALALDAMPSRGTRAEERVASMFAARILIDRQVRESLLSPPRSAEAIAAVHRQSGASLRAVCVEAASCLSGDGYVVVARQGRILFAEPIGGSFPITAGGTHPHSHLLSRAERDGAARLAPVRLIDRHGVETREFAGDAVVHDGTVIAICLATDAPPWGRTGTSLASTPNWLEVECESCGRTTWGHQRCSTCRDPICAQATDDGPCGWCACRSWHRFTERRCEGPCGLLKHSSQFGDGHTVCVDCR